MKRETTERWLSLVCQLGVRDPEALTDGLLLLLEGAATACQSYGCDGPARSFVTTAEALVDSYLGTAQRV